MLTIAYLLYSAFSLKVKMNTPVSFSRWKSLDGLLRTDKWPCKHLIYDLTHTA